MRVCRLIASTGLTLVVAAGIGGQASPGPGARAADTAAPVVVLETASRSGSRERLTYALVDDSGQASVRLWVFSSLNGSVLWSIRVGLRPADDTRYTAAYRVTSKFPSRRYFCVEVADPAGNRSDLECATIVPGILSRAVEPGDSVIARCGTGGDAGPVRFKEFVGVFNPTYVNPGGSKSLTATFDTGSGALVAWSLSDEAEGTLLVTGCGATYTAPSRADRYVDAYVRITNVLYRQPAPAPPQGEGGPIFVGGPSAAWLRVRPGGTGGGTLPQPPPRQGTCSVDYGVLLVYGFYGSYRVTVRLDGVVLGVAPLSVQVGAGTHRIEFLNTAGQVFQSGTFYMAPCATQIFR